MMLVCPLCNSVGKNFKTIPGPLNRRYYQCSRCRLIFVHPESLPSAIEEKERYTEHENDPDSSGYIAFLNRAVHPALSWLKPGMKGLDYGSGPCPALSGVLQKEGIKCFNYDPLFGPPLANGPFDFIFATETFEHFHDPRAETERISRLLKPGGILIVMTLFYNLSQGLDNWVYARDRTHVMFYDLPVFEYICQKWNFELLWHDGERVIVLRKRIEKQNNLLSACERI